ncbi:MAG: hypothetical protein Kow0074_06020 [Candidatus Zixiibacteriota bacterium]
MKKAVLVLAAAAMMLAGAVGTAGAQNIGVGVLYSGSSLVPDMLLPIKLGDGSLILEPQLGLSIVSVDDPESSSMAASANTLGIEGTQIRFGASLEKQTNPGSTSPLFGGFARVSLTSPDAEGLDSWTDFTFGVFLGGTAELASNLEFQGFWGPMFTLNGEHTAGDAVLTPSSTSIDSMAGFRLRWFVFGS